MKVYGDKKDFGAAQQVFINKLQADLQNHQEIQGILEYMDNSLSVLGNLEKRMAKIGSGELSKEEEFKALRNVRNYLNSYGVIMNDIRKQMNEASREGDDSIKENIKDIQRITTFRTTELTFSETENESENEEKDYSF